MQNVITGDQAKKILKNREPFTIVQVQQAIALMKEVQTLDESKYFADKADALATWAKIYHKPEHESEAKKLKIYAYRRMGQIAAELRPQERHRRSDGKIMGKKDGPASLLREHGIDNGKEFAATRLSRLSEEDFKRFVERPRVPSPMVILRGNDTEFSVLVAAAHGLRSTCRKVTPEGAARLITTPSQRQLFQDLLSWLDRLDQNLSK